VRTLSFGMRGDQVLRLREGLQRASGMQTVAGQSNVFDAELLRLVEDFQRRYRLNVDGVAGIQTLVVLDTALATPGTPRLNAG